MLELCPKLSETPEVEPFVTVWLVPLDVPDVSEKLLPEVAPLEKLVPLELFHPSEPLLPVASLYESASLPLITKIPPLMPLVCPTVSVELQPELPLVPVLEL